MHGKSNIKFHYYYVYENNRIYVHEFQDYFMFQESKVQGC